MIATSYQRQLNLRSSHRQSPVHRSWLRRIYLLAAVGFAASEVVGTASIVWAYHIAQYTRSDEAEFLWFWAGMLLIELPLAALIARRSTPPATRAALLIWYGFDSYIPKLLRDPTSPIFHDEFAHWRETYSILTTGKLFQPNPLVPIVARYPGLHAATAALVHATGLTIWQAATLLLILFHVTLVLGIATLARSLGANNRTASLIALLYCLNSSFLYFDTQYAYESMAITLAVWTLVAYVRAIRSQSKEGRVTWGVLTTVLSAGAVVTHHLSTLILILIMALIAVAITTPWLAKGEHWVRSSVATAWSLSLVTTLMAATWITFVAPTTWTYLSPYAGEGLTELIQVVKGSGGARQLFGASLSPWWEQRSAYLVTVLALGLAVTALLLIRAWIKRGRLPRGRRRAFLVTFGVFGLVYFPSTIFIFSADGAEGARRSWAFTWIGLSIFTGPAAIWLIDWCRRHGKLWKRISARLLLSSALAISLIGGTAAGLDAAYRFPGPFLYGSDARSVTPELLATSQWFTTHFGPGKKILSDRYTGIVFGSFGLQNTVYPSGTLPFYSLYLAGPGAPINPPSLVPNLGLENITYMVVDERMAYDLPELGVYFTATDPPALRPQDDKSAFYGKLDKFNTFDWMIKVFQSDNYSIYRLNLPPPLNSNGYQHTPPPSPAKRSKRSKRSSRGNLLQGKLLVAP